MAGAGVGLPVAEGQNSSVSLEDLFTTGAGVVLPAAKDQSASVSIEEYMTNPMYAPSLRTTSRPQAPELPPLPTFRPPLSPHLSRRSL